MTWEDRKRIYHEKATGETSSTLDVDSLEDTLRTACEAAERCSEKRFDSLRGRAAAIAAIQEATTRFARKCHLDARMVTDSAEIILPINGVRMKHWLDGNSVKFYNGATHATCRLNNLLFIGVVGR